MCDASARAVLCKGIKGAHLPVLQRGLELLIRRCTSVAARHLRGEALIITATNPNVKVLETLLESGSQLELEILTNTLDALCAWGSKEDVQLLLKHDAKNALGVSHYSSGLSQAVRKNNSQMVLYWLEEHPGKGALAVDPAAVIDVAGNGFMVILPSLISQLRKADSFDKTLHQCLQVASSNGHSESVDYLIREGANINAVVEIAQHASGGNKLLGTECYQNIHSTPRPLGKRSALQACLIGFSRFGHRTDLDGLYHHLRSTWTGADLLSQRRTLQILLKKGADPNEADGYGRCPLHIAAAYCPVETVQALMSSGAHVEVAMGELGTALQAAASREIGGLPIINLFLETTASIPSLDPVKSAALREALPFFGSPDWSEYEIDGRFKTSASVADVLNIGPGAVI